MKTLAFEFGRWRHVQVSLNTIQYDRNGDSVLCLILPQVKVQDFDQKKERFIQKRKLLKGGNEPHTVISPLKCVNSSRNFRRNWSYPRSRISNQFSLSLTSFSFSHRSLRFCWFFRLLRDRLGDYIAIYAFPHLNTSAKRKLMFRRCPALASSGTAFDCRGINGKFNR